MTIHTERLIAFGFLSLFAIFLFAPKKAPREPVVAAIQTIEAAERPEGDYRDAVIDALHARIVELEGQVADWEEHHEAVHRGECVPRPDW